GVERIERAGGAWRGTLRGGGEGDARAGGSTTSLAGLGGRLFGGAEVPTGVLRRGGGVKKVYVGGGGGGGGRPRGREKARRAVGGAIPASTRGTSRARTIAAPSRISTRGGCRGWCPCTARSRATSILRWRRPECSFSPPARWRPPPTCRAPRTSRRARATIAR